MTELSREEVLRIAGKHVGYVHGEYFFHYGCHDSEFLESEGAQKLYSEAQILAIYEAGAKSMQEKLDDANALSKRNGLAYCAERAVSDRLLDAAHTLLSRGKSTNGGRLILEVDCVALEATIAEVEAIRKEKPE